MPRVPAEFLKSKCREIFTRANVPIHDAEILADCLVLTDMRGVFSHGVVRTARYIDCILAGGLKPDAQLITLKESPALLQVSANGGLGIPAAAKTMDRLIEKARSQVLVIGTVNHSDHFGAAGYYAMLAAEKGFLAFSMSNTCPLLAPAGGIANTLGNAPFAYAAPGNRYHAILFDVCMAMLASGKLVIKAREGKTIPEGIILDKNGKPTTDPNEIFNGAVMLPFAEHKGYGFAVMVEIMASILSMSGMMDEVRSWNTNPEQDGNSGHCFLIINPEFLCGLEHFKNRVDQMIDKLKACPTADGVSEVLYPGEPEERRVADALLNGVPLPQPSLDELKRAAERTGVTFTENI